MKKILIVLVSLITYSASWAQTSLNDSDQAMTDRLDKLLVGNHDLSLQWISWDWWHFGLASITKTDTPRVYRIKGYQDGTLSSEDERGRKNGDFLKIDGTLTAVDETHLIFTGTIDIKVYHINGGKAYRREGTFDFKARNGRKYWRLQNLKYKGPGSEDPNRFAVDYVDIYF